MSGESTSSAVEVRVCKSCGCTTSEAEFAGTKMYCKECWRKKCDTTRPHEGVSRATERESRTPLAVQNTMGHVNVGADYTPRWVNVVPGRVEELEQAGWVIVTDKAASGESDLPLKYPKIPGSACMKHAGGGAVQVLMRKRKDHYAEDIKHYTGRADAIENEIRNTNKKPENYVPQGISTSVTSSLNVRRED